MNQNVQKILVLLLIGLAHESVVGMEPSHPGGKNLALRLISTTCGHSFTVPQKYNSLADLERIFCSLSLITNCPHDGSDNDGSDTEEEITSNEEAGIEEKVSIEIEPAQDADKNAGN